MVFFTGDIHGNDRNITRFVNRVNPKITDTIVLLGDVGANYFGNHKDIRLKDHLNGLGVHLLCIHGNHEMRPTNVPGYHEIEWNGGTVWIQPEFPNLLFAKDGEIYEIEGLRYLVIGGAYSVDKYYRQLLGYSWWSDEQPSDEIKARVEEQIKSKDFDIILSHTCPFKYEPVEMFISGVDQSKVDDSTERWLDTIEDSIDYLAWFCGHWHTNKRIDKVHFLFDEFETDEQFKSNDK